MHRRHVIEKRLLSALNMARTAAINHHQLVTFCPNVGQKHCVADWQLPWLIFVDASARGETKSITKNITDIQ